MPKQTKVKKETKEEREIRKKAVARQWVILCLEQGGYTNLIPKEERTTSADYLEDRKTYIEPTNKDEK